MSTETRTFSANSVVRHPMISLPTRSLLRRTDFLGRHRVARLFFFRARFALVAGVRPCGSWLTGEGSVPRDTISAPKKKKTFSRHVAATLARFVQSRSRENLKFISPVELNASSFRSSKPPHLPHGMYEEEVSCAFHNLFLFFLFRTEHLFAAPPAFLWRS